MQIKRFQDEKVNNKKTSAILITDAVGATVSIRKKGADSWKVVEKHSGFHEHHQAITWLEINNPGKAKDIGIEIKWAEYDVMAFRQTGYLRSGSKYQIVRGEINPVSTIFKFKLPPGTSHFGPVPWYSNDDYKKMLKKVCQRSPLCETETYGKTKEGRDIICLTIKNNKNKSKKKNFLLLGREHAGETAGSFAIEEIVKHILSTKGSDLLKEYDFYIFGITNPDGVENGRKFPQEAPIKVSDLHYNGLKSKDPTCKSMRDAIKKIKPKCFITFHGYLFSVPEIICYDTRDGMNMLDYLMHNKKNEVGSWWIKRQPVEHKTMLYYSYKNFGAVLAAFELPWAGQSIKEIRKIGLETFLSVVHADKERDRSSI